MGGEPLCQQNLFLTLLVLRQVKERFPQIKIYLWTGYYYEDLKHNTDSHMQQVLDMIDVLIDGPYDQKLRDVTLKMRGSSNQSIIDLKEKRNVGN
jgi:anaerobic ribonucleoside-triphosphate reductase activating protein